MSINAKKINKLIYSENYSWKPMVHEITSNLAYIHNVGFKDGETDCYSYFLYLTDNELLYNPSINIYELLLNKYIDTDYMRDVTNGFFFSDYTLERYEITKEEMELIKDGATDKELNAIRNIRLKKQSLLPYKGEKFVINWNKWKMISHWKDYLKGNDYDFEVGNGNFQIEKISKLSNDINEQSVTTLLKQQNISVNDYDVIEVDYFMQCLPTVYCYKTERDYKAGRYVFDKAFVINTTKDGELIPSKINFDAQYVHNVTLRPLNCFNYDLTFVIEVFTYPKLEFLSIDFIPDKIKDKFIDRLGKTRDPYKAFDHIKKDLIEKCVLYKEFDFATQKPIAPARLITKEEYQEVMDTAKFEMNKRFRNTKKTKAENFNHDFKIKKVSFDINKYEYTFTCRVDQEFKDKLKGDQEILSWLETNKECFLKDNELIVKVKDASWCFPYDWWTLATEETKNFKYLKEFFFLNITLIPVSDKEKFYVFPSFTAKYHLN